LSFSRNIKEELISIQLNDSTSSFMEFLGMLKFKGSILIQKKDGENRNFFVLETEIPSVARRIYYLLKSINLKKAEISFKQNNYLAKSKKYRLKIDMKQFEQIMKSNSFTLYNYEEFERFLENDPGYFGDFFRGAFLVSGYINNPKSGYHFELIEKDSDSTLKAIKKSLRNVLRINSGIIYNKKGYKMYVKSSKDILEIIELMGSFKMASLFENIVDQRQVKSDVNRSINFTVANARKIGNSSVKQVKAIDIIEDKIGLNKIDGELFELAKLRLENREMSLAELGEKMKVPMGKSAVYNRMKKIIKMSEELGAEL